MWSQDGCGSGPRAFGGRKRVSASATSINHRPSRAGGQLPRRRQGTPGRPAERGRVPAGICAPRIPSNSNTAFSHNTPTIVRTDFREVIP